MTWLLRILGGLKGYALAALGIIAAAAALFLAGARSARNKIRRKQAESALEDVREAHEIDDNVRRLSDDDLYRELHNGPK